MGRMAQREVGWFCIGGWGECLVMIILTDRYFSSSPKCFLVSSQQAVLQSKHDGQNTRVSQACLDAM